MANKIKYQVDFDVKQNSLNQLKSSLQDLQKMKVSDLMKINNTDINSASSALKSVQQDAKKVESALNKAFNTKLNTLNIQTFNKELASSNLTIERVHQSFSQVGASGQAAFNNLSAQILNTNVQLRQSSKLLDGMATSMANTIKWGITSSIFKNITGSIQSAYYYAKDLDRSLTDIRIVTGESADQMERFAKTANNAAKDLGRSTLDYTKAALSFYQQGLSDDQVQARATATLKAENITGMGSQMVDYLTSVWNGFNVQAEQAEEYVDKLAAVADTTASNMGQLATAISKVASTANAMGVDIDQLNGQVATVIATTRQAPESVGVAFKTIYARMNDIKAGTDEAQISLGNYSGKMAELGFNVLDATGHLRDTGQVIEEIGSRWEGLTRQQQINLAQTMAGQRQYNNLIALFDNWDKYLQSVNTSMSAQGTLNEKNDRYLESLEAHMQALGAEAERTYDILFDENAVKGWTDAFNGALTIFNNFLEGLGGGTTAFTYFGSLVAGIFNKQIAQAIVGVENEINRFKANLAGVEGKKQIIEQIKSGLQVQYAGQGINLGNSALKAQAEAAQKTLAVQKGLTAEQQKQAIQIQRQIGLTQQKIDNLEKEKKQRQATLQTYQQQLGLNTSNKWIIQDRLNSEKQIVNQYQQELISWNNIEQAIDNGNLSQKQRNSLADQMQSHLVSIKTLYRSQSSDLVGFNTAWKNIIEQIRSGEIDLNDWHKIEDVLRQGLKESVSQYNKIDYILKNIGIDTSKLTDEEKKRLEALLQQNTALAQQGKHVINIQNVVKAMSAGGQILSSWAGAAKVFGNELSTAEQKANALTSSLQGTISGIGTMFGPIGMGISTLLNGAISLTKELFGWGDALQDHFKTIDEKLQELNKHQQQAMKLNIDYGNDKKQVQDIAEEFEKLSQKAGKYNKNLSLMSEEEQSRYHELVQMIIDKNPSLIEGWTSQGEAIINNNKAIESTLDLLDKQYEKQMAILYSQKNVKEAQSIYLQRLRQEEQASSKATDLNENKQTNLKNLQSQSIEKARHIFDEDRIVYNENDWEEQRLGTNLKTLQVFLNQYKNDPWGEQIKTVLQKNKTAIKDALESNDNKIITQVFKTFRQDLNAYSNDMKNSELWDENSSTFSNSGMTSKIKREDLISLFEPYLNQVVAISDELTNADQIIEDQAEKAQREADAAKQLLESAKNNYVQQIIEGLRWTPQYNEEIAKLKQDWGEAFSDQIQDILFGIRHSWVKQHIDDSKYDDAESQEVLSEMMAIDFNKYLDNIFQYLQPGKIQDIQNKVKQLSEQELSAKEYYEKLWQIFNDFKNSDSFLELVKQEIATSGDSENAWDFLGGLFNIKDPKAFAGESLSQLQEVYESIASHIPEAQREAFKQILENSDWSELQLLNISDYLKNNNIDFINSDYISATDQLLVYIKNLFKEGEQISEQGAQTIADNFSKISTAISKLQSGKNLNYTQQSNLWNTLFPNKIFDLTQFNDTNALLQEFKNQVLELDDNLQRLTGLDLLVNNFEDLNNIKSELNDEDYQQLWQDTYEEQLQAVDADIEAIKEYANLKGQVFNFNSKAGIESAIAFYKEGQNIDKLGETVDTVKSKLEGFKDEHNNLTEDWKNDSDVINYLSIFDNLLNNLGVNVDYQWIVDNIDKISEALENGTFNAETFKQQVENTELSSVSSDMTFDQAWKTNENIKSAYDNLSNHKNLSDEQFNTVLKLISSNEDLNKLYEQQGLNGQHFLEVLKLIGEENQKQLLETRQAELESKRAAAQEELNNNKRTLALYGNKGIDEQAYQDALNKKQNAVTNFDIESEDLENAERIISEYQTRQKILQAISDSENQLTEIEKQQLALDILKNSLLEEQVQKQRELDKDVNKEQWQNLSNQLQNLAPLSEELSDDLIKDKEAADNISEAILRFDDACKSVADSYDDWIQALQSGSIQQQAEAISELRDTYADLLDIDGSALSQEFLSSADNLELMKAAIDGDIEAYDQLMQLVQQDIAAQLHFDTTDFENGINDLLNEYYNVQSLDDLQIGASLNNEEFLAGLEDMINKAGMTAAQATDYLASMGVDAEVVQTKTTAKDTHQYTGVKATITNNPIKGNDPITGQPITYNFPEVSYETVPVQGEDVKDNTAYSLKVTSANKSSGGGFKFSNANNGGGTAGAARRSPSRSSGRGGSGGKGGGSGKGTEPDTSKKDKKKPLEDDRDIYHDINIELQKINRQLDRTQKKQDRLYGKQFLDNLAKQNFFLQKQIDKLKEKGKLQQQDLKAQQEGLKTLGATFDQYGNMTNYMELLNQKQNDYNKLIKEENNLIKAYNKSTNKDQKQAINERITAKDKEAQAAKDIYEDLKKKIKEYDDLRKDIEDNLDEQDQKLQQEIQNKITAFRHKVEIHLELGQAQREWNDFVRNVLNHSDILKDSDFDGIFKDAQQNLSDLTTYFNVHGSIGSIEVLTKSLYDTKAIIEQIDKQGNNAIYGDTKAEAMKNLKSDLDELMKQLGDVEKLIDAIDQAYLNTIDDIAEQFDKQIEDYQYVGDLIQHDMNLLTLLYGDKNYDAMNKYYNTLQQNNEKQLDSLKQQRDFWKQRWDEAVARGETNSAKKFEENYKKTLESLNSAIEESAKLLQEKYQNSINQIFDTLDKKLTNGRGTDYLSTEWDLMNKNADEYLDTINSAFAIQSTQRKYQKALDETKSIKNQQALKKLMNQQLDILRSKEKLTEYDVERAEKMLQIEQARIALEESQSAKTSLRLKRDSQGNYSYEYAADNNAINDAEDNLAKAQNDLYNFDKDRYKSITNDMLSAWEEFKSKQLELSLKAVQGDQEAQEKLVLLREQYGQYINTKTQQNLSVRTNLTQSAFADIAAIYNNDVANYQQMADNEKQILMEQLVPIWNNGIDQMSRKIAGEGGFIPACEEAFQRVDEATRNYETQLEQMAETAGVNLEDVKNGVDNIALSMEDLIIDNRELINTMDQELGSIQALKAAAQQLSGAYRGVYDAAKVAVSAIHLFYQEQQKAAAQAQGYYNGGYTGIGSGSASSSNGSKSSNNSSSSGSGSGSGSGGSGSSGGGSSSGSGSLGSSAGNNNLDQLLKKKRSAGGGRVNLIARLDSGGYTGNWGDNEGRLAILDKKEIVLNENDTRNFLQSVNILRQLNSSLNNNMFNMLNGLTSNRRFNSSENTLQQNVHISATFPNVNSKREIEEAFSELVNLAAQRVMRS